MRPDDFWRMYPTEFWWLLDARRPRETYPNLSEIEVEGIFNDLKAQGLL